VMDPARTNWGKEFTDRLEAAGVHVSLTTAAAVAAWQDGGAWRFVHSCLGKSSDGSKSPESSSVSCEECHNLNLCFFTLKTGFWT
jgi:hypothetical protein